MSLINEALKRARVEAARQDAAAKGVPASALPVYVPPRRRPWLAPVAGFLAGLTVVAMAAGAFWLVRRPVATAESPVPATSAENAVAGLEKPVPEAQAPSAIQNPATSPAHHEATPKGARSGGLSQGRHQTVSSDTEPAPRVAAGPAVEPASASPEPLLPATAPPAVKPLPRQAVQIPPPSTAESSAELPPRATPAAPPVAPPAVERPPATVPPPATIPPPSRVPPPAVASVPPPAVPPPASSAGDSARTYLREAAPAGPSVKLEFIVWSESQPFAQINGQLLSVGQSVEDYTILTVERERVELEGGGVRFWLRVR